MRCMSPAANDDFLVITVEKTSVIVLNTTKICPSANKDNYIAMNNGSTLEDIDIEPPQVDLAV